MPYDKLREVASNFLNEHHPSREIPVPIEHIVDNKFKIDIIPTPGLHRQFDIDSFITSDLASLFVDEYVYESRPQRYRFSLAHEISHVVVHRKVFEELEFSSISQWKQVVAAVPEREYGLLEYHANSLAGLILVPSDKLQIAFDEATGSAAEIGIDIDNPSDFARDTIEKFLAKYFDVSSAVIHRRMEFDDAW